MTQTRQPVGYQRVYTGCPPGPAEGQRVFPVQLDFSISPNWDVDFSTLNSQAKITSVQAIYIDNLANANAVIFTDPKTLQRLVIPPSSQAYMPLLSSDPPVINVATAGGATLTIHFLNFYMPPYIWGTTA